MKYRVVFHVDDESKAGLALVNIENLLADLGEENVEVELVANYKGVLMYDKEFKHRDKILKLKEKGVTFIACAHSIEALGIPREKILDFVKVVPSGVGEIVKRQAEGWSYIKP